MQERQRLIEIYKNIIKYSEDIQNEAEFMIKQLIDRNRDKDVIFDESTIKIDSLHDSINDCLTELDNELHPDCTEGFGSWKHD